MKSYLYSILTRFYLAFSGFLVFLLTASLYGADGRGIIGFGTSLFAIAGIVFSANLGRSFVAATKQSHDLKKSLLRRFLKLNLKLSMIAAVAGLSYWYFVPSAQDILSPLQAFSFALTSIFYVWSINGNALFASFVATKKQENIILFTRTALILFMGFLYLFRHYTIDTFIIWYSILLAGGSLAEMFFINKAFSGSDGSQFKASAKILKDSLFHHVDFLSFNIFPLLITVLLASYVSKSDLGRFNFALQIINLIFLFSTTANIRITAYVSDVGSKARMVQYKKLFWATLSLSAISVLFISLVLSFVTNHSHFEQFKGAEWLFLISGLAIPGYVLYQFFSPIWIELHKQKEAAIAHGLNFLIFISLVPYVLSNFKLIGAVWLFSCFHLGLILTQGYLYKRYAR